MPVTRHDTLQVRRTLTVGDLAYDYFSIPEAEKTLGELSRLPFSLKVLLENLLRFEDGRSVTVDHLKAMRAWVDARVSGERYEPKSFSNAGGGRKYFAIEAGGSPVGAAIPDGVTETTAARSGSRTRGNMRRLVCYSRRAKWTWRATSTNPHAG